MASDEERVEAENFSEHESIDETRDLLQLLMAEVQVYPGIWNKKSPAYKEAQKKKLIWEKIAMKLQIGVEEAKKKWKNLYDSYKKCKEREREQEKSGSGYTKNPTCRYYNELHFLQDIVSTRTTTSNIAVAQQDKASDVLEVLPSSSTTRASTAAAQIPTCPVKRPKKEIDPVDKLLINALTNEDKASNKGDDADTHFCLSLVEAIKSLPQKKNLMIKSKIMSLVYEAMDD
ncbi:uncharacterized protein LOC114540160 [Dendronephthya gigantea]|uniref:uncharacterized protein LOC114540160 n=1 Tax=Dendronephthya gigantea TaxID=151771 RepID=UPI00106B402A|nr:uncharacterized protein LOC114540160 [Dendronephthya gigantea]